MKKLVFMVAACATAVAFAETKTITSESEIATKYGADRIIYDGPTATHAGDIEFAANGNATTIEVKQPDVALTLKGKLTRTGTAAFVKNGPGTLLWCTTANNQSFSSDKNYYGGKKIVDWNADGSLRGDAGYGWCEFIVTEGTFVYDSPGMLLDGYNASIGTSSCTVQPIFIVSNGTFRALNTFGTNWNRPSLNNVPAIIRILKNGRLETNNFWANWSSNSGANKTEVEIDGGQFINMQKGQSTGGGTLKITVTNGGVFDYNYKEAGTRGSGGNFEKQTVQLPIDANTSVTVNDSTFSATVLQMNGDTAKLTAEDSNLKFDRWDWAAIRATTLASGGQVSLNGVTLMPYTPLFIQDWFVNPKSFTIGAKGLTVTNALVSAIDGNLTGGDVTKKGPGVLAMQAVNANVNLQEGAVSISLQNGDSDRSGTVTAAAGTKVMVSGIRALADMTLKAGDQTNEFLPPSPYLVELNNTYNFVCAAQPTLSGWIRLNEPTANANTNSLGQLWQKAKMDVTKSFTVDFDYVSYKLNPQMSGNYYPYGFSVGWQNVGNNVGIINGAGRGEGWNTNWANSFAFGYDAANSSLHYTVDGKYEGLNAQGKTDWLNSLSINARGTFDNPTHCRITYDAVNHTISMRMKHDGYGDGTLTAENIDLAALVGAGQVYFGFCGGNNSGNSDVCKGGHLVRNIKVTYGDMTPEAVNVGGTVEIAEGKTFKAAIKPNFGGALDVSLGTIQFADGAVLEANGAGSSIGTDNVIGDGTLVKTGDADFGVSGTLHPFSKLDLQEGGIKLGNRNSIYQEYVEDQTSDKWQMNQYATHKAGGDHTPYTWDEYVKAHGTARLGHFLADGFVIGRDKLTNNKGGDSDDRYVSMINSKNKIAVNKPFRITFDGKMDIATLSGIYGFYNMTFHNDPRGVDTIGTVQYDANHALGGSYGVENSASIVWGLGNSDASKDYGNKVAVVDGTKVNKADTSITWTSTLPVHMGHYASEVGYSGNHVWETNGVYTLTYDPDHHKMHVKMEQMANGALQTFETDLTINIEKMVGATEAYLGFGCSHVTDWYGFGFTVRNLKIDYFDDDPYAISAEKWWTNPWSDYLQSGAWKTDSKPKGVGATFDDKMLAFTVGRENNCGGHFNDYATCKTRLPTDRSWKVTFKDRFFTLDVKDNRTYSGLVFHNDPRGYEAYTANTNAAGVANENPITGISNKFGYLISHSADINATTGVITPTSTITPYKNNTALAAVNTLNSDVCLAAFSVGHLGKSSPAGNPEKDVATNWYFWDGRYDTNADFTVSYDYDAKKMTLRIDQDGHTFTHVSDVDLATDLSAPDGVYMTFAEANPGAWYNGLQTVSNLVVDTGSSPLTAYIDELSLGEGEHLVVRPDALADKPIKLANTVNAENGAILGLDGETVIDEITCDGRLTVDGGILDVGSKTLTNVKKINLTNGAKISIPAGMTIKVKGFYVDGVRQANGTYSSGSVIGGGTLEVATPGMMLLIR